VTPADHIIEPVQEFRRAVHVAANMAAEHPSALVTFGIPPTYPATGYGYIQRGEILTTRQGIDVCRVQRFQEKPSADVAEQFLALGEFLWNSGIFVWRAAAVLDELHRNEPELHAALLRVADDWPTAARNETLATCYPSLKRISIDFAVMQKAREVL